MVEDNDLLAKAKTWDDLGIKPEIKKGLLSMNFISPSKIQATTFPLIMKEPRLSIVAQAKNGSGKTAAFGLGVISSIDPKLKDIQAVILCLNRELINQITGVLKDIAKNTDIKITSILLDSTQPELGQVLVMTPVGFVNQILIRKKDSLKYLKMLVLDEADEILINETTSKSIKRAFATFKREKMNVQILFFSATFNTSCLKLIRDFYKEIYMIELEKKKEDLTLKNVKQYYQNCTSIDDKVSFIEKYLNVSSGSQKVIIFVNKRDHAVKLQESLFKRGKKVFILMGHDMNPQKRDETIKKFKDGEIQILITTDLLARGYDERSVKLVINFSLPVKKTKSGEFEPNYETYLHRIGRTGRFGSEGIGVNLCMGRDYENLMKIEAYYKTKIEKMGTFDELLEEIKKMVIEDK